MFLVISSQQEDPDDGNLSGLQAHGIGHDEGNIKEATEPGRKVGMNFTELSCLLFEVKRMTKH